MSPVRCDELFCLFNTMEKKYEIKDEFRGDDEHLRQCIKALIEMSDDGILIPHGLGGHARNLLAASYHRLKKRKSKQNH